ncbi:MAG: hypothetical protein G01um101448_489 [Parcubacteria group bacterium Gr01-1014_48]|nr:MAG: hypothetical protein Greene041614_808 [Parcubacteria group bacterium Greene0416_14]TSC73846.1 MAG: hypothetical protein G01um101448_489 [Parcubacteria group bacterium Gr01-1014_48]TSD00399.1 MAG: hypothetical protein Greene101415_857 [Parcubacteria group bacterium Greene1014_15]TSD07735.1 MAG: hypothetical protein Greene07144_767 [Parcubacteria group bacterium Greene0714_4]
MKHFSNAPPAQKSFLILLSVAIVIFVAIGLSSLKNRSQTQAVTENTRDSLSARGEKNKVLSDFPIPLDHPNVGSVFVHYFLTGTIDQIKNVSEGTQIVLEGAQKTLPQIIATKESRISRISQPYSDTTLTIIRASDLRKGMQTDISIEYELRSRLWIVRDIFIPTDRNP